MTDYESELNDILGTSTTSYESNFDIYNEMVDSGDIIHINGKTVSVQDIGVVTKGDANSQMYTFEIDRYQEGVDLSTKKIVFLYRPALLKSVLKAEASNVEVLDDIIRFRWVLDDKVALLAGGVTACIQFIGTDELNRPYSFITKTFSFNIDDTLNGSETDVTVEDDWFTKIESKLQLLEKLGLSVEAGINNISAEINNNGELVLTIDENSYISDISTSFNEDDELILTIS